MLQKLSRSAGVAKKVYEYYRYVVPYTFKNVKGRQLQKAKNISIFSTPRAGSTWLSHLFCAMENTLLISEPLYLDPQYPEIKKVNFPWNPYIPEQGEWPEAKEYFRQLLNHEIGASGSYKAIRLYFHNDNLKNIAHARYFIIKCVNSTALIPWLTKNFTGVNPIFLIRHPCAVVASQMQYQHWDSVNQDVALPILACKFDDLYKLYKDIIGKIRKPEERLAVEWAMHNCVASKHADNNKRWITTPYEKLYTQPSEEIDRIFSRLDIERTPAIDAIIRKPSISSKEHSHNTIKTGKQLEAWRNFLSQAQIRNILAMTKEFGMDFYDESPEPDYPRIYNESR
ncbi:MAG TPA: sulfotransferase [Niastella sp.]|nr:sulfotransferase [Niastella sp.]